MSLYVGIIGTIILIFALGVAFLLLYLGVLDKNWLTLAFTGLSLLFLIIAGLFPGYSRGNSLYRSNLTRAVAGLGYVVTERNVSRENISKHYDLHELVDNEC